MLPSFARTGVLGETVGEPAIGFLIGVTGALSVRDNLRLGIVVEVCERLFFRGITQQCKSGVGLIVGLIHGYFYPLLRPLLRPGSLSGTMYPLLRPLLNPVLRPRSLIKTTVKPYGWIKPCH